MYIRFPRKNHSYWFPLKNFIVFKTSISMSSVTVLSFMFAHKVRDLVWRRDTLQKTRSYMDFLSFRSKRVNISSPSISNILKYGLQVRVYNPIFNTINSLNKRLSEYGYKNLNLIFVNTRKFLFIRTLTKKVYGSGFLLYWC